MSAPILTTEPASIRAGDSLSWLISLPDYPAASGWSLSYALVNADGRITLTSAASGNSHSVTATAATTANYKAGTYTYHCRVSNGADVVTVAVGTIDVLPDLATMVALDTRTHAAKVLAKIEAWLENHDPAVAEYEIAGRRMKYIPIAELLKLRDRYSREVRGQGGKSGRIYLRF